MKCSVTVSVTNGICAAKVFDSAISFSPKPNMTGLVTRNNNGTFVRGLSRGNGFL